MALNVGEYVRSPEILSPWPIGKPEDPWAMVQGRFDDTLAKADILFEKLVGVDGVGGILGDISSSLEAAPIISITAPFVDTSVTLISTGNTVPVFDDTQLVPFVTESYPAPVMAALPPIDISDLSGTALPAEIDPTFTWTDAGVPTTVYAAIITRMLQDLQSGATGLDPAVETAMFDRARTKQQFERDQAYNKLNNDLAGRNFTRISGALAGALTDFAIEGVRQAADINNNIVTIQADLAQKNSQFMFTQAVALENLIRQTVNDQNNRGVEVAKTTATLMVQNYAEQIRAYVALWDAKKAKVSAQAEMLKGVVDSNRGLIDIYKAQYDAYATKIQAIASVNKGVTDVFLGEVQGFAEAEKAVSIQNQSAIEVIKAKVMAAELEVKAAIAEAEQTVSGYASEQSVKEKIIADVGHITATGVASIMSAVSASASLGYTGSSSESKSVSSSASISESHSYEHDPLT